MIYVIDTRQGHVAHETRDAGEARRYAANASEFGSSFTVVAGAKARDVALARIARARRK